MCKLNIIKCEIKMDKKLVLTVVLAFSLLLFMSSSYITSAFLITDTYRMRGEITTGGHVNLSTSDYKNLSKIAVGQPIIGIINNTLANLKLCFGVFCTDVYQPQYSMNFSGRLNYSNGSVVVNAPVKVVIKYSTFQKDGMNWTSGLGEFFVKIDDLPEYITKQDLNITFYVQGEIEAVHDCYYNRTEGYCCKQPGPKRCKP
jgi:hypothetical protein